MGGYMTTALSGSDQELIARTNTYGGFFLRETSGSAVARVDIYDNASAASGLLIDSIALAPGESAREHYDPGITVRAGIYIDVTGAVAGGIRSF